MIAFGDYRRQRISTRKLLAHIPGNEDGPGLFRLANGVSDGVFWLSSDHAPKTLLRASKRGRKEWEEAVAELVMTAVGHCPKRGSRVLAEFVVREFALPVVIMGNKQSYRFYDQVRLDYLLGCVDDAKIKSLASNRLAVYDGDRNVVALLAGVGTRTACSWVGVGEEEFRRCLGGWLGQTQSQSQRQRKWQSEYV